MRAPVLSFALFCALALAAAVPAVAQDDARRITVQGSGQVAAEPDMAVISMGVEARAETARAAMDETSEAMAAMLARLEESGLDRRDMQTSALSLSPVLARDQRDGPQRIDGFAARNELTLRVRDLGSLGAVMDAVLSEGANRFGGLRFSIADPEPLESEARRRAVTDAMSRARELAEAAGVELGPVRKIHESGGHRPVMREMAAMSDAQDSIPVAAGEITIEAEVSMEFAIGE
ncbi:MAG: SIMPL domain-containing protein [Paracoccaceae bacterium]